MELVDPITPTTTLDDPRFYLKDANGASAVTDTGARAVLYRGDQLIDVGQPVLDQVVARGAQIDDRLCVYDLGRARYGCKIVTPDDNQELPLINVNLWLPDVQVALPNTRTLFVQVRNVSSSDVLHAQLFYDTGALTQNLPLDGDVFTATFELPGTLGGNVRVWRENAPGEIVVEFSLGGEVKNPNLHGRNPNLHGRGPNLHGCLTYFYHYCFWLWVVSCSVGGLSNGNNGT